MEQLTAPVGVSLKNILVATDFSASSVSALVLGGLHHEYWLQRIAA